MKTIRKYLLLVATLGFCLGMAGCSMFSKKDKEEDDGLSRWDDDQNKPSRFQRWAKWEHQESQRLWRQFRDN